MDQQNPPDAYELPGKHESLWLATSAETDYSALAGNPAVDVAIVGGGIVGVSAAWLLKEAGLTVAILESRRVIAGVTGYTTAKITSQHGLIYNRLISRFGADSASIYAQANQAALEMMAGLVATRSIDCDFVRTPAYIFAETDSGIDHIEAEATAGRRLGLPVAYTEETSLPFAVRAAVRFDGQAQFHPRKYLLSMLAEIPGGGSHVFEKTRAIEIEDGGPCTVLTNRGRLKAEKVIIATHFPFYDKGFFYARLLPKRDYVLTARIKGPVPEGMYYSKDGSTIRSLRNQPYGEESLLLVCGGSHKSGDVADTVSYYRAAEEYARSRFDIGSIGWRWSTQDYDTVDGLPYIGKSPGSKSIYIACGFGGWGMTNGTLSAMIISDDILGAANPWAELFEPGRISLRAVEEMAAAGVHVMTDYTREHLTRIKPGDPSALAEGEGRLMRVGGKKAAVCRDESKIHQLSIHCPHMNCLVNWNKADKTWDCPCHGSQFDSAGKVIHGPALAGLTQVD